MSRKRERPPPSPPLPILSMSWMSQGNKSSEKERSQLLQRTSRPRSVPPNHLLGSSSYQPDTHSDQSKSCHEEGSSYHGEDGSYHREDSSYHVEDNGYHGAGNSDQSRSCPGAASTNFSQGSSSHHNPDSSTRQLTSGKARLLEIADLVRLEKKLIKQQNYLVLIKKIVGNKLKIGVFTQPLEL